MKTETKIYRLYGVDIAINMLRPLAKYEMVNGVISKWNDKRPCPSTEEIYATLEKLKQLEDSIDTIWLPEQIEELSGVKQEA